MTAGNIGDNIIAVIGARNDPVLAGSDTAAAVGWFAACYPFDLASVGPAD